MLYAMMLLNQLKSYVSHFKKDEDGAALIEYTVLLGLLLIAVIAIIGAVGGMGPRPVDVAEHGVAVIASWPRLRPA
jgi:pilus assembly protein Flp/PilA